jgi:hypothetical protein
MRVFDLDPDAGTTLTYTLVSGDGSTDNDEFNIDGTSLIAKNTFDYESKSCYYVRVQVSDGDLTTDKQITISVLNVNEAPYDISLSSITVPENVPIGTTVGTFSTADPDAGDTFTYSFASGSNDNSYFNISGATLLTASAVDFETQPTYFIQVITEDAGGLSFSKSFTISVSFENDAPTDIILSTTTIPENSEINTVVGTLTAVDEDAGDTHTFSLVTGAGSTDNSEFNINGNELRSSSVFDFETKSSLEIRIRATDSEGLYYQILTLLLEL